MDLDNFKEDWRNEGEPSEKRNKLLKTLFVESRQSKINTNLSKTLFFTILMIVFNFSVIIYALSNTKQHFDNASLLITSIVLFTLSLISTIMNIHQFSLLVNLKNDLPIIKYQSKLEKLKLSRIKHNRFIFIFSYFYTYCFIILFSNIDLIQILPELWNNAKTFVIIQSTIAISFIPFTLWILKKYDNSSSNSKFWKYLEKDSMLTDSSLNSSLNETIKNLKEIEEFEKL